MPEGETSRQAVIDKMLSGPTRLGNFDSNSDSPAANTVANTAAKRPRVINPVVTRRMRNMQLAKPGAGPIKTRTGAEQRDKVNCDDHPTQGDRKSKRRPLH